MLTRYASAAGSSALITVALLFLMQFLISLKTTAPVTTAAFEFIDVFAPDEPDTPLVIDELMPKPDLSEIPQHPPRPRYSTDPTATGVALPQPPVPPVSHRPDFWGHADGALVVLVRVAPLYPANMAAKGLEGHVLVQFDVAASGAVVNAFVVESSHTGFERAALNAAGKFKYKPRIVDGIAMESTGIQSLFRFTLDKD